MNASRPATLESKARGIRTALFLTAIATGLLALVEAYRGIPAPPLFWVRIALCVTALAGAFILENATVFVMRAVCLTVTGVGLAATTLMASSAGGSLSLYVLVIFSCPLLATLVLPDDIWIPLVSGVVSFICGLLLLHWEGHGWLTVVQWTVLMTLATGLAAQGTLRFQKLRAMLNAQLESDTQRLTQRLATAAGEFVRLRSEMEVAETVTAALTGDGIVAAMLMLEGGNLVLASSRHATYPGQPRPLALSLDALPHVQRSFRERRLMFHEDVHTWNRRLFAPDLAERINARVSKKGVEAPIFVEGEPFGLITAQGDSLSPAFLPAIELFARHIGGAIENVRHHRRAEERLQELTRLQEELVAQERLAALGEAAAVVSHEVRNPLGAIVNAISLLKRSPHLADDSLGLLNLVEEEVTRLDTLVHDLLYLARPLEPKRRPLDLAELVKQVSHNLQSQPCFLGLHLEIAPPDAVPPIEADPHHLQLALENLLRNAAQVSPRGGQVTLALFESRDSVCISVEDQGPGIAPANIERIFEPFFTTRVSGTGLGLAIVKRVAEAHGGNVRVGTKHGPGARFELTLPCILPMEQC